MKALFLACALALPSSFFTKPPLNRDDLEVFKFLMQENPRDGDRILIIGYIDGWIQQLRNEGWLAHGVTTRDVYKAYWLKVKDYHTLPFRAAFFKVIMIMEPTDRGMLFEMDRLLVPQGFVGIDLHAKSPYYWYKTNWSISTTYPTYEAFLNYLKYKRIGMVFHGIPIWRKQVDEGA